MPITDNKILTPMTYVQDLARKPTPSETMTYMQLQAKFDQGAEDLRVKLNATIDDVIILDTNKNNNLNAHKTSADHDGRYYTETEINTLLTSKTNLTGDHQGTWQGRTPVESDPGIQAIVNEHTSQLADMTYQLKATDNLQTILDSGKKSIELNPNIDYSFNNIKLPTGTKINGNGAKITSLNTNNAIFYAGNDLSTGTTDIIIENVRFFGFTINADNLAMVASDCGLYINKSARIKITNCRFENFLGAGINCFDFPSNPSVDYHMQHNIITDNVFHQCYFGLALWNRAEFGICSNNIFSYCRIGIWSQSGNWNFTGNTILKCRAGFVSTLDLNSLITIAGINPQHGSFTGNIVNHCRADQTCGWATTNFLINTKDYQGIWIDGASSCFPPAFSANTMYYSDLLYYNSLVSGIPVWYITGCTFSSMTIYSSSNTTARLVACTEVSSVTKTNIREKINFYGSLSRKTSNQSIANNLNTVLTWDEAVYGAFWVSSDNTKLTVPDGAKKVKVITSIAFDSNATGHRQVDIFKNGVATGYGRGANYIAPAPNGPTICFAQSAVIDVIAGDYFTISVNQDSSVPLNVLTATTTWFAMEVVEY